MGCFFERVVLAWLHVGGLALLSSSRLHLANRCVVRSPRWAVPGFRSSGTAFFVYPELLTNCRLHQPIWHCLLRYARSPSSTYQIGGYACGVFGRKPSMRYHIGCFAAKADEKSGLEEVTSNLVRAISEKFHSIPSQRGEGVWLHELIEKLGIVRSFLRSMKTTSDGI